MAKKAKQVESWGDIDPKVFAEFEKRVEALREEMIPRDCDNDSPIQVVIVNKMTHSLSAYPVPRNEVYSYDFHGYLKFHPDTQLAMDVETERWLSGNASAAADELRRYFSRNEIALHQLKSTRVEDEPRWCPSCKSQMREKRTSKGDMAKGIKSTWKYVCMNPLCKKHDKTEEV
jgi:hypothetical protein